MSITIFCDYRGRILAFMTKMAYFYSAFLYFWYVSVNVKIKVTKNDYLAITNYGES